MFNIALFYRPAVGHMIMTSWLESLQSNHIQSCYWSFLLNGYSTAFLEKHAPHMSLYINAVAKGNPDNQRLIDLISHAVSLSGVGFTQDELEADPYSIVNVSKLITCPVQVCFLYFDIFLLLVFYCIVLVCLGVCK